MYYDGIVYCFFCYNRQQQHAVSVIYTADREDSSSINMHLLVGGCWLSHCLPTVPPRTLLSNSRETTLSVHYYYVQGKGRKKTHGSSVFGTQQLRQRQQQRDHRITLIEQQYEL